MSSAIFAIFFSCKASASIITSFILSSSIALFNLYTVKTSKTEWIFSNSSNAQANFFVSWNSGILVGSFELGYLIKNPSPYFITSKILIIPVLFASVP